MAATPDGNSNGPAGLGAGASNRPNVSVTNINCGSSSSDTITDPPEGQLQSNAAAAAHNAFGNHTGSSSVLGAVRITVPKMEESDDDEYETELTNIVNMRASHANDAKPVAASLPRPMSWEGELSDTDDMDTRSQRTNIFPSSVTVGHETTPTDNNHTAERQRLKQHIVKPSSASDLTMEAENLSENASANALHQIQRNHQPQHADEGGVVRIKNESADNTSDSLSAVVVLAPANSTVVAATCVKQQQQTLPPANPSPDSAIHSVYTHSSPSQSPLTSRHAPYNTSLSRNNSDASHSSCYSYSSEFSPTHSPIQGRHIIYPSFNGSPLHHSVLYRPMLDSGAQTGCSSSSSSGPAPQSTASVGPLDESMFDGESLPSSAGISRQQLINSPCPICGDKISGFHYGIFSCESCKGFFKRTVQNRKNYVCLRGAACPVTITTRKKCPACRFEKCLQRGMKLEAIREDRTRGGRSTYQCGYSLSNSMLSPPILGDAPIGGHASAGGPFRLSGGGVGGGSGAPTFKMEQEDGSNSSSSAPARQTVPVLLQDIMDVEHLWQYNESERTRLHPAASSQPLVSSGSSSTAAAAAADTPPSAYASSPATTVAANPLLASAGLGVGDNSNPDLIANLCNVADHRLYKIVKWCKSLPLFKHISIDDQICLLINSWCELLLFSCCFRSISTPGEIRISLGKSITLDLAKVYGLQACIERMLNLTDHLRRLRVDKYEYVAMKVIVLLQSDTSDLKEPEKVRASQEKALQALQEYTLAHYPDSPAKFGELLLRIPELQRTCQVGKEMLTIKSKDGEDFNLLMELLRGEH